MAISCELKYTQGQGWITCLRIWHPIVLQRITLIKTSSIGQHILFPVLCFMNSPENFMSRPLSPGYQLGISYKMYLMMTWWKRRKHIAISTVYEIRKQRESCVAWKTWFLYMQISSQFQKYDHQHTLHIYAVIICQSRVGICFELIPLRMKDMGRKKAKVLWKKVELSFHNKETLALCWCL